MVKKVKEEYIDFSKKKILIGIPSFLGLLPAMLVKSLMGLRVPVGSDLMIVERRRTDDACNSMAMHALKNGFDYLMIIGDDNPVPPNTAEQLVLDDKDIIIAPIIARYPDQDGNYMLCAYYKREVTEVLKDGKPLRMYTSIKRFKDEGPLHRIDVGGTGTSLFKRKVLEKMYEKYQEDMFAFTEFKFPKPRMIDGVKRDRRTMSEDVEFCERASDLGFEIWLDERIRPIHITAPQLLQWKPE